MNTITAEDINYLSQQSSDRINMILAGMTALMNDTNSKVSAMESQNWFKRMVRTVTGKNKMTQAEIEQNHDKLNAYMSEAIAELYNRNCIDSKVMISLGIQINELYIEHVQLKQMLGAFINKLNEKIDSVDNFHMLTTEIEQGVYTSTSPIIAVCKVISQFDNRILSDNRKLDIIKRDLVEQGILNNNKQKLRDYINSIISISIEEVGQIYLELGTIKENFMAKIILDMIQNYHFLSDMARKMKNKDLLIEDVINKEGLDNTILISIDEIYDDFVNSKIDVKDGLTLIGDTSNDFQYEEEEIEDEEIDLTYSNEISSDTYDIIKSQCEIYLMLHEETNYDVTYKLKKGLGILYEEVYLAHDDTLFKNGRNGFAITEEGIYCREFMGEYTNYVTFEELAKAKRIYIDGSNIYADDELIAYLSGSNSEKNDLKELFETIAMYVGINFDI